MVSKLDTEVLIDSVKQHPILYDTTHAEYKNLKKKDHIWAALAEQHGLIHGEELKKKWKNIRDTYAKYLKSTMVLPGDVKKNYTNWMWAKHMKFIRPFMNCEWNEVDSDRDSKHELQTEFILKNEPSSDTEMDNQSFTSQNINEISSSRQTFSTSKRKRTVKASGDNDFDSGKYQKTDYTATELVFLGYAKTVQGFSPERRTLTKLRIAQIIAEDELEQLKEESGRISEIDRLSPVENSLESNEQNEEWFKGSAEEDS